MSFPVLTDKPTAMETAAAIRGGTLSAQEAVEYAIARIERLDAHINAVVVTDFDRAIDAARELDEAGPCADQPLFGVPMTIKESFDVAGLATCWGHQQYAGNRAESDSQVVARLKAAGAIILGKTNVPVDLTDWQSVNPVYGRTNNPHDHARSAGGSSGGSAAAVASGMVPCEFGTDIGGSVRVPAHFCGVWGHKTSWGVISKAGHDHPMMTGQPAHDGVLSIAGPIARDGTDLAALLDVTAQMPLPRRDKPLRDCRMLLLLDHPVSAFDGSVRRPIEAAVHTLEAQGARIDRKSDLLPELAGQHANYMRMLNIALARGLPGPGGKRATATDWFDLLDAQAANEAAWARLFADYEFVLAPPAPVVAFPHRDEAFFNGKVSIDGKETRAADGLAWAGLATFPNLPATVLPIGESDGMPCGMQVIGPRWSDFDCIAAAIAMGETLHR